MTLLDLCEPLFMYVCRLNRSARRAGHADLLQARSEINGLLEDMRSKAASGGLGPQYGPEGKIEEALVYFVDHMMINGDADFAMDWQPLAAERFPQARLAGDEMFVELLKETLKDSSSAATERLGVYYVCMGLGFHGYYNGEPQNVPQDMMHCAARMRGQIDTPETVEKAFLCHAPPNDAYVVDGRDLTEPPSRKLLGIALTLVAMVVVLFVMYIFLWNDAIGGLSGALNTVLHKGT